MMKENELVRSLYRRDLFDDFASIEDYLQIINDYMMPRRTILNVLDKASKNLKKDPDFDYYSFIVYGLIASGKN